MTRVLCVFVAAAISGCLNDDGGLTVNDKSSASTWLEELEPGQEMILDDVIRSAQTGVWCTLEGACDAELVLTSAVSGRSYRLPGRVDGHRFGHEFEAVGAPAMFTADELASLQFQIWVEGVESFGGELFATETPGVLLSDLNHHTPVLGARARSIDSHQVEIDVPCGDFGTISIDTRYGREERELSDGDVISLSVGDRVWLGSLAGSQLGARRVDVLHPRMLHVGSGSSLAVSPFQCRWEVRVHGVRDLPGQKPGAGTWDIDEVPDPYVAARAALTQPRGAVVDEGQTGVQQAVADGRSFRAEWPDSPVVLNRVRGADTIELEIFESDLLRYDERMDSCTFMSVDSILYPEPFGGDVLDVPCDAGSTVQISLHPPTAP